MTLAAYATVPELLTEIGDTETDRPPDYHERLLVDASRVFDRLCNAPAGYFDAGSAAARSFTAVDGLELWTGAFATTTGLVVKLDEDGDRTYETTLSSSLDYFADPVTGPPYWRIVMDLSLGRYRFTMGQRRVQVTASWGYSMTPPEPVRRATLLIANRYRVRPNSPQGIQEGSDSMMQLAALDPDVALILDQGRYRIPSGFGARVLA